MCQGHNETKEIERLTRDASLVESGTSTTLSDARALVSNDVRFPEDAAMAAEKLAGWSIVIDIFHGEMTDIAVNVPSAVREINPALSRTFREYSTDPHQGMDIICHIMFDMQQSYFDYLNKLTAGIAAPRVPDFQDLISSVSTFRASSLTSLPMPWYLLMGAPLSSKATPQSPVTKNTLTQSKGVVPAHNVHADVALVKRFHESSFNTVQAMLAAGQVKDEDIPKHAGKPVCLTWELKGACSSGCRCHENHKRYSRTTIQAIHGILDKCGVAQA